MSTYAMNFRGQVYHATLLGLPNPRWAIESFTLEADVRERWWQIKPGDVVMDVGAGFGSYSLTALAAGAGLVVAVEPGKEEFFALAQNMQLNHIAPARHLLLNCCVMDSEVVAGYDPELRSCAAGPSKPMQHRQGATVDSLVRDYRLPKLDWLKVDVEGAEVHVLAGASETLKRFRPAVLVEIHPEFTHDVEKAVAGRMEALNYRGEFARGAGINDVWSIWRPQQ